MGKKRQFNLIFPEGGLVRKLSQRQTPPFTSPDCLNVRPSCVIKKRKRPGSRPGTGKYSYNQLGSGNPIRMAVEVDVVRTDGLTYTSDYFENTSLGSSVWSTASWIGTAPSILEEGKAVSVYNTNVGAVHSAISDLKTSSAYQIEMEISPYMGEHHGTYSIFALMNDTTPVATTDGVVAALTIIGSTGVFTGSLKVYNASSATTYSFTGSTDGMALGGVFKVLISSTTVSCYWNTNLLKSQAVTLGAGAGKRFGFGMTCSVAGGICFTNSVRLQYYSTLVVSKTRKTLCVSSNGILYRETFQGTLAALSSNLSLNSDRNIQAIDRYQKLYIADNGNPKTQQTDGAIDVTGLELTSATIGSGWEALSVSAYDDVVIISAGTGSVTDGTYKITSVAAGKLTLASSAGGTGTCAFTIQRAPKIYDPTADTLTIWTATAGKGQVPTGCTILFLYRDRACFCKDHIWYMSRQGDFLDWDYEPTDPTDPQRAVSGQETDAGIIGDILTAGIPFSDDLVIFGCKSSLWRLRGDPAYGGQNDNVSYEIGIVSKNAYCRGPNGELYFLSYDGIYGMASAASLPQSMSRERLPLELVKVDPNLFEISMSYDSEFRGIHIYLTPVNLQNRLHWFFDFETKSFWPVQLPDVQQPTALLSFKGNDAKKSCTLLGCKDGYLRYYNSNFANDDGTAITSYVMFGPMRLSGNDYNDGKLIDLTGYVASESGEIDWAVHVGDSHEDCVDSTAFKTGTWSRAGLNPKQHPHARGGSFALKISNGENTPWAIENINCVAEILGTQRVIT